LNEKGWGMFEDRRQRFPLGRVVATANANSTLDHASVVVALRRHASGDWGELDDHDRAANQAALQNGDRLVSVYHDRLGTKFYIITEWDRSETTVLLPEDY
jgi:hypothetical protein